MGAGVQQVEAVKGEGAVSLPAKKFSSEGREKAGCWKEVESLRFGFEFVFCSVSAIGDGGVVRG